MAFEGEPKVISFKDLETRCDMERLTRRDEFGNASIIGVNSADIRLNLFCDEFNKVTDALNKLAEYEDLEEEGLLLKPPCKVGDIVYIVGETMVSRDIVSCLFLDEDNIFNIEFENRVQCIAVSDFGKTVFSTPEQAEQVLKERKGED